MGQRHRPIRLTALLDSTPMAGRIPQAFLDDLLDRVDIVEVIDRRVKLKKAGKNYSARCPFHDEKTPSFSVNPEKQFYYCFGCGAGGNALGFVMDYENIDFPQAVESLAQTVGLEVPREAGRSPGSGDAGNSLHRQLYELMETVAAFYRRQLREHRDAPRAVEYLKGRGLSGVIAGEFDLGYAPPGWDNLLTALGTDEARRTLLEQAGMLVRNDAGRVYDRFRDRIMFPIRDNRGRLVAFGGRVLGDEKPKYLNSPETPVFQKGRELYGLHQARKHNRHLERVLIVEGYMDVIALAQHDVRNATATLGTATSQTHLQRLYRLAPEVVFCFDGDEAGRKAAFRAMEAALPCLEDGRQARFLFLPEGEDPDSAVRKGGTESFNALVRNAVPLETFLFDNLAEGIDLATMDGRARLSKRILPHIRRLPEGVYRQLMMQALAERTGLELSSLEQLSAPAPAAEPQQEPPREARPEAPESRSAAAPPPAGGSAPARREAVPASTPGTAGLVHSAIALLLHRPDMANLAQARDIAEVEDENAGLLRELLELLNKRPGSNTAMLLGHWYGTPEGELLARLAGQERLIPSDGIEQQFSDTLAALRQQPERARLAAQVDKLRLINYADLSDLQKQELRELLLRKQQLDQERSPGQ